MSHGDSLDEDMRRIHKEVLADGRRFSKNERLLGKVFSEVVTQIKEKRPDKEDEIRDTAAKVVENLGEIAKELYSIGQYHSGNILMGGNPKVLKQKILANLKRTEKAAEGIRGYLESIRQDKENDVVKGHKHLNKCFIMHRLKIGKYDDAETEMHATNIEFGDDKQYMERLIKKFMSIVPDSYFSDMEKRLRKAMKGDQYRKAEIIIEHAQLVFPNNTELQERLVTAYKGLLPLGYTSKF